MEMLQALFNGFGLLVVACLLIYAAHVISEEYAARKRHTDPCPKCMFFVDSMSEPDHADALMARIRADIEAGNHFYGCPLEGK